jgi:hypothetical protein
VVADVEVSDLKLLLENGCARTTDGGPDVTPASSAGRFTFYLAESGDCSHDDSRIGTVRGGWEWHQDCTPLGQAFLAWQRPSKDSHLHRKGNPMPEKDVMERAQRAKRKGKAPSSQAGEFVREEIHKIRRGEHGARSPKQAIAIGLSKARSAGVNLPPPEKGKVPERTRRSAESAYARGHGAGAKRRPSATRSRAISRALKREPTSTVSHEALSRHARQAAAERSPGERSAAARKAVRTKGAAGRRAAARKAARTRARS